MQKKFLFVLNMTLELTRKCNLSCKHCMRGPAENLNMQREVIEKVFDQVKHASSLYLAGGELMLAPELLFMVADVLKEKKVSVGDICLFTNGTLYNEDFFKGFKALRKICENKNQCHLLVSADQFHQTAARAKIGDAAYHQNLVRLAKHPCFTDFTMDCDIMIEKSGNAAFLKDSPIPAIPLEHIPYANRILYKEEHNMPQRKVSTVSSIVVNTLGDIVMDNCYKKQKASSLGHVNDRPIDDMLLACSHTKVCQTDAELNEEQRIRNQEIQDMYLQARCLRHGIKNQQEFDEIKWITPPTV